MGPPRKMSTFMFGEGEIPPSGGDRGYRSSHGNLRVK